MAGFGLFLMNKKGLAVLEALVKTGLTSSIRFVMSSEDKNMQQDYYDEIRELCAQSKIDFFRRNEILPDDFNWLIAIGWRWLISFDRPLIVLHDSLLPRYRGFSPLVSCLLNREPEIGVTALYASEEYDEGDILIQKSVSVHYPISIQSAVDLIASLYAEIAVILVRAGGEGSLPSGVKQDNQLATYSVWRDEEDYRIDWTRDAADIEHFVNCVGFPYKGASAILNGMKIRIRRVVAEEDVVIENRTSGKVLFVRQGNPVVICGRGLLKIVDAVDDISSESVLPLRQFRSRLE